MIPLLRYLPLLVLLVACTNERQPEDSATAPASDWQLQTWPTEAAAAKIGQPVGVAVTADNQLLVVHRGVEAFDSMMTDDPVVLLDPATGTINGSWGRGQFRSPHGLHVDRAGNVWLTDIKLHQVFKYDASGKLLLTLGQANVKGTTDQLFDQPTDVAVAPDGHVFVTDGYGNRRVVKFTAAGEYVTEWGREGNGPSEFINPHAIDIHDDGTLFVCDRENKRIQSFDGNGELLRMIPTGEQPYAAIVRDGALLTTTYLQQDTVVIGSDLFRLPLKDGSTVTVLDRTPHDEREPCRYHDVIEHQGAIYLADLLSRSVHKFEMSGQ